MHLLWGLSLIDSSGRKLCFWVNDFTHYIWPWIDTCLYSLFPFLIIIVCNAFLKHKMVSSNRTIHVNDQPNAVQEVPENSSCSRQESLFRRPKQLPKRLPKVLRVSKVTRMLQVMNISFFILTMPIVLWGQYYHFHPTPDSPHGQATMLLLRAIVNILQYTNNSVHFFLYCLTSSAFRRELYTMYKQTFNDDDE